MGFGGFVDDAACERRCIVDAHGQRQRVRFGFGPHDADDLDVLAVVDDVAHVFLVTRFVDPDVVLFVIFVEVSCVDQLELHSQDIVVNQVESVGGGNDLFLVGELLYHLVELGFIA